MKKYLIILAMVFLFGCGVAYHQPGTDDKQKQVPYQSRPVVFPEVNYVSDPTFGKITNNTRNVRVKVWVNPKVEVKDIRQYDNLSDILGNPNFILVPGLTREAYLPLGIHLIYAEGLIKTRYYGWKSLGFTTKDIVVDSSISGGGHYGWYLKFRKGDFRR